jgi:hypothetical protein
MPYSSSAFDQTVFTLLTLLKPASVCDIGPGAGKYAHLVAAAAKAAQFGTRTTAVEIDATYVERFNLSSLYNQVIIADADELISKPVLRFDLVIIGDCLEHMRKSKGCDLINFLIYRSGYIIIIYPDKYIQDDWEGHAQEAHISAWGESDFVNFGCTHSFKEGMHLFLIKGYQPTTCLIERLDSESVGYRSVLTPMKEVTEPRFDNLYDAAGGL